MAYKKFIKKNGKVYGPYIYHSKRIGDKVVSNYIGKHKGNQGFPLDPILNNDVVQKNYAPDKETKIIAKSDVNRIILDKRYLSFFVVILVIIGLVLLIRFVPIEPSGRATLQIDKEFQIGELIDGALRLQMKRGEFIPKDSVVRVKLGDQEKSINLGDILGEAKRGNFFAEGTSIEGSGEGYGFAGEKRIYPDVKFQIVVKKTVEVPEEEKPTEPSMEEPKEEQPPEQPSTESSTEPVPAEPGITGAVISEEEEVIEASISNLRNFSYSKKGNERIEIRNVHTDEKELGSSVVLIYEKEGEIIFYTNYFETEEGFGKDYVLDEKKDIEINLGQFGIIANEGELEISILYNEATIVDVSKQVAIIPQKTEEERGGKPEINITNITEINVANITELNITVNETNIVVNETNLTTESGNVTIEIIQGMAVIGRPVEWEKRIEGNGRVNVDVPDEAENVVVQKIAKEEGTEQDKGITGRVVSVIELKKEGILSRFFKRLLGALTGRVVAGENNIDVEVNDTEIAIVKYTTPGPEAREEIVSNNKKRVIVSSDLHYENVLAFTALNEQARNAASVKVYWVDREEFIDSISKDNDKDGFIDYVEWIIPSLSNQTFEITITILNVQSYPTVGGNWSVSFNATGSADLKITAANATTWTDYADEAYDLRFLELRCGDTPVNWEFINESAECSTDTCYVLARNYSCGEIGYETSKVLTPGEHTLKFEFGNETAYAFNLACDNNLNTCGSLDVPNCVYNLTTNVQSTGTCFSVIANNVTLEGNGFSINHSASAGLTFGVSINGYNGTTIRNAVIREAGTSINTGIRIVGGAENTTVLNNTLIVNKGSSDGVRLNNARYTKIISNNITVNGTSEQSANAIDLLDANFTRIIQNKLSVLRTSGASNHVINLASSSNNNLSDNEILSTSNTSHGIRLSTSSLNNILLNNTMLVRGNDSFAILLLGVSNTRIINNTINTSGPGDYGIFLNASSNFNIIEGININVSGGLGGGIRFDENSQNNNVTSGNIITLGTSDYGILLRGGKNYIFNTRINTLGSSAHGIQSISIPAANGYADIYDSIINASASNANDVNLNNNGDLNLFNTTLANRRIFTINSAADVRAYWYLDTYANYSDTNPAGGVNISVWNNTGGNPIFSELTAQNGRVNRTNILEYLQSGNPPTINQYNNYTINATKASYSPQSRSINFTSSRFEVFTMQVIENITECTTLTESNKVYRLMNNINWNGGNCIVINVDHVTFDGQGFMINVSEGTGAAVSIQSNADNVTVKNLRAIGSSAYAIAVSESGRVVIINNSISGEGTGIYVSGNGIILSSRVNVNITQNNISIQGVNNGISILGFINASITSNNITTYNSNANSIFLNDITGYKPLSIISRNNIKTFGTSSSGIYVSAGDNQSITFNNILISGNFSYGIYLTSIIGSNLSYNNISTDSPNSGKGILLSSSNSTNIFNNTVSTSGAVGNGIELSNSNRNKLVSNTVVISGDNSEDILLVAGSKFNLLIDNNLTHSGTGGLTAALYLKNGPSSNEFINTSIRGLGTSSAGIVFVQNSYNNTFYGTRVLTNGSLGSALWIFDGYHNFTMVDSILNATAATDLLISNGVAGGEWNFTNVTFVDKSWSAGANGTLNVHWYVDVNVTDPADNTAQNAEVNASNVFGRLVFNATTDSQGKIPRQIVLSYSQNSTNFIDQNNHTFNASKINFFPVSKSVNISTNTLIILKLGVDPKNATCGNLDQANSIYNLTRNVSSSGTCFNVITNNITLDCQGYEINYSYSGVVGYGVFAQGNNFTIIRNCRIVEGNAIGDNKHAIFFLSVRNSTIRNNTILTNGVDASGISLSSSSNQTISNNIITTNNSGLGISLESSSNFNNLTNNSITTSGPGAYGIFLSSTSNFNALSNNIVITNGGTAYGIYLFSSSNQTISNNIITTNSGTAYGISLYSSSNQTISNNIITTNGSTAYGISLSSSSKFNALSNNIITTNSVDAYGIYLFSSSNFNNLTNNSITTYGNGSAGINFAFSSNNSLSNIHITTSGNLAHGILLSNSNKNSIFNSTIDTLGNSSHGIFLQQGSNNNAVIKNLINVSGDSVNIFISSNGAFVSNNSLYNSGRNTAVINISTSYNVISFNNITGKVGGGFFIYGISLDGAYNNITYNFINISANGTTSVGRSAAIYLPGDLNFIAHNSLTSLLDGIYVYYAASNLIINNTITSVGNNGIGINLEGSFDQVIENTTISVFGNNTNGIRMRVVDSPQNTIKNTFVKNSGAVNASALLITACRCNLSVTDSVLNGSSNDILIADDTQSGEWNFTNVTGKSAVLNATWKTGTNGTLNLYWYVDAFANYSDGRNATAATIEARDINNVQRFSAFTGTDGRILRKTLLEYKQTNNSAGGTITNYYSNYTIKGISPEGVEEIFQSWNMSTNRFLFYQFGVAGIDACGNLNKTGQLYTLIKDVSSPITCFNVTANQIALDCQGFEINYSYSNVVGYGVVSNSSFTTVKNCRIVEGSNLNTFRYAIFFYGLNHGRIVNNSISTFGVNSKGISFSLTGSDSNIANNDISIFGPADGILLSFDNSTISGNNISTFTGSAAGIRNSGYNNSIINNLISTNGSGSEGAVFEGSKLISFSNNTMNTFGSGSPGMLIVELTDSKLTNNVITTSGDFAFGVRFFTSSTNNSFFNITVKTNNTHAYGFYISSGNHNFSVLDGIINASYPGVVDFNISRNIKSGEWNFTNVTRANGNALDVNWQAGAKGTLNVMWYVDAFANYSNGLNASNSNISSWNVNNIFQFSNFTGQNGRITRQIVLEYKQTNNSAGGTITNYYSNYTFNASHPLGRDNLTQSWNMSTNRFLVFTFNDVISPQINFINPTPPNGTQTSNTSVEINVSIVDDGGVNGAGISNLIFNWNRTNYTIYNDSLVLMMNMDNRSSLGENDTYVVDVSKYGNNGTCSGTSCPIWTASGKYGGAFDFDGSDDFINLSKPSSLEFSNTDRVSVCAWVYNREASNSWGSIVTRSDQSYVLQKKNADSKWQFTIYDTTYRIADSNDPAATNVWTYLCGTFNGTNVRLYVNAIKQTSEPIGNFFIRDASADELRIGDTPGFSGPNVRFFNGLIDEVRIWNRGLSADEVREQYYSNLYKYDQTQWYLYVNQSNITNGTYMYYSAVNDLDGNFNMTEVRVLKVGENNLPIVTLDYPPDGFFTTNRTPLFNWTASDPDGDALTYQLNITCFSTLGGICSPSDDRLIDTSSNNQYAVSNYLKYLIDNNYYYNWTVRANDGIGYGDWAVPRRINIQALIDISLNPKLIEFGEVFPGVSKNTSEETPLPFIIENNGTVFVNVSINASRLFILGNYPSSNYQFKIRENEAGSYSSSLNSWTNFNSILQMGIVALDFNDVRDSAKTDVLIIVPAGEPPGARNSTVTFLASLGE